MIRNTNGSEKLYLSKKPDEIIYIDNCKIPQHQIDGIRFLFKQYRKKQAGVIINSTAGLGRNLQIVLFLKAISHTLKQPALILCPEGAEHSWMEQFNTWTDLCDEVILETQKPYVKKQVIINTMANLSTFCHRNWSILVVDLPEMDKPTLQVLGLPFKADYKIWVTPIKMNESLDQFSKIYKWLFPKGEFDKNDFIADENNAIELVDKLLLLDAFMADIVASQEEIQSSFEDNTEVDTPTVRISLKNKDATGKKIKRSKRKIYEDDDDNYNDSQNTASNIDRVSKDCEISDDFSIDNFKRKRKDFDQSIPSDESDTGIKMDTLNSQSQVKLVYEPESSTDVNSDMLYEMDTLEFDDNTGDKQIVNVNESINEIMEATETNYLGRKDANTDTYLGTNDLCNSDLEAEDENKKSISDSDDNMSTKSPTTLQTKSENNDENGLHVDDRMSIESPSISDESKPINNELDTNTKSLSTNELIRSCDNNFDKVHVQSHDSEPNGGNNTIINKMVEPVTNNLKSKSIDDKLKELEEKVMKKFKGSILESLI